MPITKRMEQNRTLARRDQLRIQKGGVTEMEERTYKIMGGSGALNIALGVVVMVVGVAGGVLLVISGAKLLAGRNKILF